ncbi:MAG: SDR family oxidoreductase [Oscillospiraceae bacterium]|jgi:glucose 1-dehydrogenase|nr:SDR family oxidoreductase [Oscillospiraceae bacterium]
MAADKNNAMPFTNIPKEYTSALDLAGGMVQLDAYADKPFDGMRVLVTGGGKGVGKGIALAFALRGARVAIGCNSNPDMARDTLDLLRRHTEAELIPSDIGDPDGCDHLVDETVRLLGGLDVVVSNAAIQTNRSMLETTRESFERTLAVNTRAPFLLMKRARPHLTASGAGRFIMVSSVHGKRPTNFDAAYASSKGAMLMLCREAAIAFARDGVTVNIIAPGAVVIEGKTGDPKSFSVLRRKPIRPMTLYPLGRVGVPMDTGEAACFLASRAAGHITGTTIRVDGGSMLL